MGKHMVSKISCSIKFLQTCLEKVYQYVIYTDRTPKLPRYLETAMYRLFQINQIWISWSTRILLLLLFC